MQSSSNQQEIRYKYKVKFINPKKKSDFVLLSWHQGLNPLLKLMDNFKNFVFINTKLGFIETAMVNFQRRS